MNDVFEVLTQNILPIFLVAALGFWLRRYLALEKKTLSTLVFYALSPCLVFTSLANSQLPGEELFQLVSFAVITILIMGLVSAGAGWLLGFSRTEVVALILVLMFVNGGNYGLTLNHLRYGMDGLSRAVVYYVTSTVMVFTVGVFIASMGQVDGKTGNGIRWQDALWRLLRLPPLYAVILALVVYGSGFHVPAPLMRGVEIAGAGAIPVMLIVLGMQMADVTNLEGMRLAVPATLLRLLVGPLTAVLVSGWLGLSGLARSVSILEASMPTAVIVTILATEFEIQPAAVTTTVLLSTLLSMVTLPLVIYLLAL